MGGGRPVVRPRQGSCLLPGEGNQQFLAHLIRRDKLGLGETKLDPATLATLEQIRAALPSGNLLSSDYAKLLPLFDDILKKQYPET